MKKEDSEKAAQFCHAVGTGILETMLDLEQRDRDADSDEIKHGCEMKAFASNPFTDKKYVITMKLESIDL